MAQPRSMSRRMHYCLLYRDKVSLRKAGEGGGGWQKLHVLSPICHNFDHHALVIVILQKANFFIICRIFFHLALVYLNN